MCVFILTNAAKFSGACSPAPPAQSLSFCSSLRPSSVPLPLPSGALAHESWPGPAGTSLRDGGWRVGHEG